MLNALEFAIGFQSGDKFSQISVFHVDPYLRPSKTKFGISDGLNHIFIAIWLLGIRCFQQKPIFTIWVVNTELPALVAEIYPHFTCNRIRHEGSRHSAEVDNLLNSRQVYKTVAGKGRKYQVWFRSREECLLFVLSNPIRIPHLFLPALQRILCLGKSHVSADVCHFDGVAAEGVGY